MMKEEVRHADNEKIDLKVWKRLIAYGLRYKPRVIRTILVLLVVSGADLAYPLFTRYEKSLTLLRDNRPAEAKAVFQELLPAQAKILECIERYQH